MKTYKKKIYIIAYLFIFTAILLSSCKKKNESADCGCKSEAIDTIPDTNLLKGVMGFKHKTATNDYLANRYWITVVEPNSIQVHHLIVCNNYVIPNSILAYLQNHDTVSVSFSGYLKYVCDYPFSTPNITYNRIALTKIVKQ